MGMVVGRDGKDGENGSDGNPGRDGMGFDDLDILYDGNRELMFRLSKNGVVKDFKFKVPVMIYREVFTEANTYEKGDSVSFGGSIWVAMKDTSIRPGTNTDWRLAVKRGVDGKKS
jgi:hypothetical protein